MSDTQFTEFDMATKPRVVIVGVGFAGAFAETALSMRNEVRRVDTRSTHVLLLDFADRVLTAFHPALSARAKRDFEGMGIEVFLNTRVTEIDDASPNGL